MGESNVEAASLTSDIFRTIFSFLDRPAYWLLGIMYQLFFNVASADLFSNDTVMKFYGRVQLILGVFMMFKLALIILKGIIEPEGFFGGKKGESSGGSFITKVITGLVILTLMMPISIPGARNEYEIQINNNGLLFGTLYSLQHRLLANNTLGRFILGNDDMAKDYTNDTDELKKSARIFTSSILKGFYRINLLPEDERPKHEEGKDDAVFNDNRVCKDIDDDVLKAYTRLDADPGEIISMVNLTCEGDAKSGGILNAILGVINPKYSGKSYYVFAYMPFISMVVPLIFVVILLSFTIDVAVRAVKLAVLRLIAPIPIISYMDPKGSKDSAFNSWVKTLTSTYLDLFIRLAAVYFAIFLIQDMIKNGIVINRGDGVIGIISLILIWIGIFVFAKEAPKFIKDVLGLKGDGGRLFGGLSSALGVAGIGASAIGSTITGYKATAASREANGKDSRFLAKVGGAIRQGVSGTGAAIGAFAKAKDHQWKAVTDDSISRNTRHYNAFAQGATYGGIASSRMRSVFGGDTEATKFERDAGEQKAYQDYYNHAITLADNDNTRIFGGIDSSGRRRTDMSVKMLKEEYERIKVSGASAAVQKQYEDAWKDAQSKLVSDVMNGNASTYEKGEEIKSDYDKAVKIADKFKGTRYAIGSTFDSATGEHSAGLWKKNAKATASSNEYALKQKSATLKPNDSAAGVGGKK